MNAIKQQAAKVEAIAREAFETVCNEELRLEIMEVTALLNTMARHGVANANEVNLYADSFDMMTQGRTHRIIDRNAKRDILEGMREMARLAEGI